MKFISINIKKIIAEQNQCLSCYCLFVPFNIIEVNFFFIPLQAKIHPCLQSRVDTRSLLEDLQKLYLLGFLPLALLLLGRIPNHKRRIHIFS